MFLAFRTNSIAAGDTLYLRGGTYLGGWLTNYANRLTLDLQGATNNPITVRPYGSEHPILNIGTNDQTGEILIFDGQFTILRDVEVTNQSTNRYTSANYAVSITCSGQYNKLINSLIHDTGEGIYIQLSATNTEVYGCTIWNNGAENIGVDSRGHGHGFYARSAIPTTLLAENIVFNQFGLGFQCYTTSSSQPINGFRLEGNASFGNGRTSSDGSWSKQILVGGGGLADNLIVYTNFTLASFSGADGTDFGCWGCGAPWNPDGTNHANGSAVFSGNHFLGDYNYMVYWTNLVFTNNFVQGVGAAASDVTILWTIFPPPQAGSTNLLGGWVYDWNRNTYNLSWGAPFQFTTNRYFELFPQWTNASTFDANSTFTTARSTAVEVYVRTNKYDANRANIIVVNWPTNNTVSADISGVVSSGRGYSIYNMQDPLAAPIITGTYSGGSITLPMTNLSVAVPVGASSAPPSVGPLFAVFQVRQSDLDTNPFIRIVP